MVTHAKRPAAAVVAVGVMAILSFAAACDKVPLLAPTGSVINLFASSNTVPLNGEIEIVANVIEQGVTSTSPTGGTTGGTPGTTSTSTTAGAGTPVQNGTLVSFTTTIGRIEPSDARTNNGQVRVRFISGNQSGTATITAFSGGASGKLENLKVGSAGVERVLISASPQTLGPAGGSSTITARVEDMSGTGLAGIPVTFTTDAGSLSNSSVTTDSLGNAATTLTTSRPAKVTANVAGKTADVTVGVNPRTGVTIAVTSASSAGVPATFTVGVNPPQTSNIRNVTVDFGDGSSQPLGAISAATPVQHTYAESGTYTVSATATDTSGFSETVSTAVTILPGQPPSVTIRVSNANPSVGESIIVTATVEGNTSTIIRYEWNFGSGAVPATVITASNRQSVFWTTQGTKGITVTVFQASGPSGDGATAVVVKP